MKKKTQTNTFSHFYQYCFILSILLLFILSNCIEQKTIKIGFVGPLTGRNSDMGRSGRDGVMLAIEETNRKGGINGKKIELLIKDDMQNEMQAYKADKELIQEDVTAIIGHMTSAMSIAAIDLINKEKVVMVSPTTSTNELSALDDYFMRVTSSNKHLTSYLAHFSYHKMNLKKIAVLYDLSNSEYSQFFYKNFKDKFELSGGTIIYANSFTSGKVQSFSEIIHTLLKVNPDGILIIAGSLDTAMICQQLRKQNQILPILASGWSMTAELIQHAGPAGEGIIFCTGYNDSQTNETLMKFNNNYYERFRKKADFPAIFGYEAAQVIIQALTIDHAAKNLKETIINQGLYEGLLGKILIDKYGDTYRDLYIYTVKNGKYEEVETR